MSTESSTPAPRTIYLTTPIYYVNGPPHIGHAYTTFAADTIARWHRLAGHDVRFLTGTDEHGQKVEKSAREKGITPQAHVDGTSGLFRAAWDELGITYDDFIRTTDARHKAVVQDLWRAMEANGDIYLGKYEGWYSVGDEAYFTEDELVDGKAPSGHAVTWTVEPSYFFRLSKYGPKLLAHLRDNPQFVRPESRYNEVLRFVEGGLQDISISRTSITWGVPSPADPKHVVYVWLDALTNYMSALGGPDTELSRRYWPHVLHLLGKDIIRFHAVYWPCFLMAAGWPLPQRMFAHGWWVGIDGQKMGKSFGNAIEPISLARTYGRDCLRYFLMREGTFGTDNSYSEKSFVDRINGDLANDYGNLASRSLGMLAKYEGGIVPARGEADRDDDVLRAVYEGMRPEVLKAMDELALQRALSSIWELVRAANKYVDSTAPWVLARDPAKKARLREVMYSLCETLRIVGTLTLPFLPDKATALLDRIGVPAELRTLEATATWGLLPAGLVTQPGEGLFPRLEKPAEAPAEETPNAPAKAKAAPPGSAPGSKKPKGETQTPAAPAPASAPLATPTAPAAKPETAVPGVIKYDDFAKLALRVARVLTAERHPDADRLLVLTVDAGEAQPRTLCAGIAVAYAPEDLVGRTVVLLANLEPRKIRGIVSNGMLLAAGEGPGLKLLTVPGELPPGTAIG
jgi:methionyl-tRNA synthetase